MVCPDMAAPGLTGRRPSGSYLDLRPAQGLSTYSAPRASAGLAYSKRLEFAPGCAGEGAATSTGLHICCLPGGLLVGARRLAHPALAEICAIPSGPSAQSMLRSFEGRRQTHWKPAQPPSPPIFGSTWGLGGGPLDSSL